MRVKPSNFIDNRSQVGDRQVQDEKRKNLKEIKKKDECTQLEW
jgi:hypothetical protein